ncbi:MAG: hypothetical protein HUJ54_14530, partial [Erysipelotrichaceae bacterium]|nr:hypothetical protein [Erysipelotrichaceae bacterium]
NTFSISQGVNGGYSHQGANALDLTGKDAGIDPVYAPVTMKCVWKDSTANGNACFFESTEKVEFADGTVDYASFMFIHDNDVSDIQIGQIFKQNQKFYDEGTAGQATGNHIHMEVKKGKLVWNKYGCGYYRRLSNGVYILEDSIRPDAAMFMDADKVVNNGQPTASGSSMSWVYVDPKTKERIDKSGKKWRKDGTAYAGCLIKSGQYRPDPIPGMESSCICGDEIYIKEFDPYFDQPRTANHNLVPLAWLNKVEGSDGYNDQTVHNSNAVLETAELTVSGVQKVNGKWCAHLVDEELGKDTFLLLDPFYVWC